MDPLKDASQNIFSNLLSPAVQTNPFGTNRSGERAYRRAERIVAAVVLLTNHIPPGEELKNASRNAALMILPQVLDMRDEMRSLSSPKMVELLASIRHLISLLKMMVFGSFISTQNAEVVIAALEELTTLISLSTRSILTDTVHFSKEDFLDVQEDFKGHIRDIKDRSKVKDISLVRNNSQTLVDRPAESSEISPRSKGIISILKTGGELMMPDIAAHLPEYGEKTIQRELNALIAKGLVKRTGTKRWSKYSVI